MKHLTQRALAACMAVLLFAWLLPAPAWGGELSEHAVRSPDYWGTAWKERPLQARVAPAPAAVLEYLQLDALDEEAAPPVREADPHLLELVRSGVQDALAGLPPAMNWLLEEHLLGVFLARGIGSSGYVEGVATAEGYCSFIVLDAGIMEGRKANEWASMREASFFRPGGEMRITMTIAPQGDDDELHAVRYILLHELGHVLGLASGVHPDWNEPADAATLQRFPFVRLSWLVEEGYISRYAEVFPWRKQLKIYGFGDAGLEGRQAPEVYAALQQTNYPSLYAAVNPFEDFAESFVVWQHAVRERRPWRVSLRWPEGEQLLESCLQNGQCPGKAAFMSAWFRGAEEASRMSTDAPR